LSTPARLGLLACLYLSQGLPFGFFTVGLPALMRQERLSLGQIGLTSLLSLPWALKFLWSPFVDRHGRRRAWIVPLQSANALALAAMAWLDFRTQLPWIFAGVLLVNLLAATQDIATDALAVDLLTPEERGPGNGVQVAAYRLGMVLGGGVLLMLLEYLNWFRAFLCMAAALALATLPILRHDEAEPARATVTTAPASWQAIAGHFARPGAWRWALILALYKGFESMAGPMVKPMLVDLGYSVGAVGAISGTVGSLAALTGALAGGWGVARLGRDRALLAFGGLQVAALPSYALPALHLGGEAAVYGAVVVEHFVGSMATAALFTRMMDACRPGHAATDYTIQACVVVVASGFTSTFSGYVAQGLARVLGLEALPAYAAYFAFTAALSLAGLVAVARLLRRSLPIDR
jgi:MFS family permease